MATIYFTSTANTGDGTLRQALLDAQDGDVVEPDPTIFGVGELVSVAVSSPFEANSAATLRSGAARLQLSRTAAGGQTLFNVNADLTVEDVVFVGRVYVYGDATFRRCEFHGNAASVDLIRVQRYYGVALYDCVVSGGLASGVYCTNANDCSATVVRSTIVGNVNDCNFPNATTIVDSIVDPVCSEAGFFRAPPDVRPTDQGALPWQNWNIHLRPTSPYASGATTAAGEYDVVGIARGRDSEGTTVYAQGAYELLEADYYQATASSNSFSEVEDWRTNAGGVPESITRGTFYVDKSAIWIDAPPQGSTLIVAGRRAETISDPIAIAKIKAGRGSEVVLTGGNVVANLVLGANSVVSLSGPDAFLGVSGTFDFDSSASISHASQGFFAVSPGTTTTGVVFSNVVLCGYGAGTRSVVASKVGRNYAVNIVSDDSTIPVLIEYKESEDATWTIAQSAFVGSTYAATLDGDVSFRVYDGEKFTEAEIKVYGFYNELAARVEIGYLI